MWLAASSSKRPAGGMRSRSAPMSSASSGQRTGGTGAREGARGSGQRRSFASPRPQCQLRHIQPLLPGAHHQGAANAPKVLCTMMGAARDASRETAAGHSGRVARKRWELGRGVQGPAESPSQRRAAGQKEKHLGKAGDAHEFSGFQKRSI